MDCSRSVPTSKPSPMALFRDCMDIYERKVTGYDEYSSTASSRSPANHRGCEQEEKEPGGRRSSQAFRDQEYQYQVPRAYSDRISGTGTGHRGSSNECGNYQAAGYSYKRYSSRHIQGAAEYYDDRAAAASYHHSRVESDMSSMEESETSSTENSWGDDLLNRKPAGKPLYDSCRYTESSGTEETYTYSKQPPAVAFREKRVRMKTIEVSPGHFFRLRGADETRRAIECDFYMPCECMSCRLTMFCIQDARLVLCPDCRVVSPMEGTVFEGSDGGVGLGFKMEALGGGNKMSKNSVEQRKK